MADLNIGNSSANIIVNAKHNGAVNPQINNTYDLGTSTLRWKNIYGNLKGNADTATKLTTARTIQTNLASTISASFDGSANITPGVTGVLPIANGGTGNTAFTANRITYSETATKLSSSSHYMSNSQVSINSSNAPASGVTLNINGATTTSNYIKINGSSGTAATTNYISLGEGYGNGSGKNGLKVIVCDQSNAQIGLGQDLYGSTYELSLATTANGNNGKITFGYNTESSWSTYTEIGHFSASGKSLTVIGNVIAPNFIGNASTATKATQDSDGNAINTTYLKKTDLKSSIINTDGFGKTYTFTKTVAIGTNWTSVGIASANLPSGVYIVYMTGIWDTGKIWQDSNIYAGIMSWYNGGTNSSERSEILLHTTGHAHNEYRIFLSTLSHTDNPANSTTLEIKSNITFTKNTTITFKFVKMV